MFAGRQRMSSRTIFTIAAAVSFVAAVVVAVAWRSSPGQVFFLGTPRHQYSVFVVNNHITFGISDMVWPPPPPNLPSGIADHLLPVPCWSLVLVLLVPPFAWLLRYRSGGSNNSGGRDRTT
jgi:hypothetical protein